MRQIILKKRNTGEKLSSEEMLEALKFFTEEEIVCMRFPIFDHAQCFKKTFNKNNFDLESPTIPNECQPITQTPPEKKGFVYGEFNP